MMTLSPIEIIETNLIGKKIKHVNTYGRTVILEIESVKIKHQHRQITPDTKENDFWGDSCEWDTILVTFIDGSSIDIRLGEKLEIIT